jgi:hypothetical protein
MKQSVYIDEKTHWQLGDTIIFFVLVCYLTLESELFENQIPGITNVSIFVCLFVSIVCLILWSRRGYRWVPAGVVAWILLIGIQKHAFSVNSGMPFDLDGIGDNSLLIVIIIFFFLKPHPLRIAKIIYVISLLYIAYYIYLSFMGAADPPLTLNSDASSNERLITGYLGADISREARLYLCGSFVAFTLLYALGLIIYERQFIHIIPLALSITAFYLAQSRSISAILILSVWMMFLKKTEILWLNTIGFGAFVSWSFVMLYGIVDHTFNPFIAFQDDSSGWVRYAEYETAQRVISNDPVFGTGIAATLSPVYQAIVANSAGFFAAADIGSIGIWTYFGFAGLIFFFIITYLSFFPGRYIDDFGWYSKVLHGIGFLIALYGVIAPTLMLADGRLFFAVVLYSAFHGCPASAPVRQ